MLEFVKAVNEWMWGLILLIILCGTGIFFTIRLKFIQVRKFGEGCRLVFGHFKSSGGERKEGEMTPFQSLATAIAAQVGTGNLTGAATALIAGGPGAIFWMWVSAFFGMATIYGEATLAQEYKTKKDGEVTGGPVYYIHQAFKGTFGRVLAVIFAIFIILALGFMGNMVQSNSIGAAFSGVFESRNINIPPVAIGIILAVIAAFIFVGGTTRLAAVVEKIVPFMAGIYIVGSLILIGMNITALPGAFKMIFVGAFNPTAVVGGAAGITVREAIRYGVARGLFSNEAGMGSTPHAHAQANVAHAHDQGVVAMIGVFIDTFVVLTLNALVIICTLYTKGGPLAGGYTGAITETLGKTNLAQTAFGSVFGASLGAKFVAICLLFFAFSTILSWNLFGKINANYLFGRKNGKLCSVIYTVIALVFIFLGTVSGSDFVWELTDMFNNLIVLPNVIALFALTGMVVASMNEMKKDKLKV